MASEARIAQLLHKNPQLKELAEAIASATGGELYNLVKDPGEQDDLAARHPPRARVLRMALNAWIKETGARIPKPDARFNAERRKQQDAAIKNQRLPRLEAQHARFLDPNFQPNPTWWGSRATRD